MPGREALENRRLTLVLAPAHRLPGHLRTFQGKGDKLKETDSRPSFLKLTSTHVKLRTACCTDGADSLLPAPHTAAAATCAQKSDIPGVMPCQHGLLLS